METVQGRVNREMVEDTIRHLDESATLNPYDQRVECDTTDGAITVTLPSVAMARGCEIGVYLVTDGGTDVTIQDQDDSMGWDGDYTLDDAGDGYLFKSDGKSWWPIGALA